MSIVWPYPFWIAHRGAGRAAPENTLAAFRHAAARGWRGFECDLKLSADGELFLLHDDTLDRTTDGHGAARDRTWDALSRLDAGGWHGPSYAGEPLPRFEAIARFVQRLGGALNAEIKPCPGRARETGEAVGAQAARVWRDAAVPPLLSSFDPPALEGARHTAPHLPRALLLEAWRPGWLDEARALGCVAVVAHHPLWEAASIADVHRVGLRALAYTVNAVDELRRLQQAGIDGVITDEVERFDPRQAPGPAA